MTGYSVRGKMGFVAKEGGTLDARINVRLHSDELSQVDRLKREDESRADYIRAALREKMLRDARRQ